MRKSIIFLCVLVATMMLIAGGAAANPDQPNDSAQNTTENESDEVQEASDELEADQDENETQAASGYTTTIDSNTRILEWRYVGNAFHIKFEADSPTHVTLTEAVQFEEGSGQGSIDQIRLLPGETEHRFRVESVGGEAAVTIVTDETLDEGYFVWLSTGQTATEGPLERTSSTAGWMGGLSVALIMTVLAGWQAKRKQWDEPRDIKP